MKVLQLTTHMDIGGIPTYIFNLSKYLLRKNIEVAVASCGGTWEEELRAAGIKTFYIDIKTKNELSFKVLKSPAALEKIKRDFRFDIIHAHTRVSQVAAALYGRLYRVPYVSNFHGFYPKNLRRRTRRMIKAQGQRSIAITPQVKEDLIKYFRADPAKVKVIVSGIDLERLDAPCAPMALNGSPRIGASGRLSPVKGFKYLIRAMPAVLKVRPQAHLYICGSGPQKQELTGLIAALGLNDKITLTQTTTIASFLKNIDLYCLPSLEEPLGLAVLEAQYFGVPPVVSDTGGLTILVKDAVTGIVVPRKDPERIAQALLRLDSDANLKTQISENCRRQVREDFDLAKKIDAFIAVYRELAS